MLFALLAVLLIPPARADWLEHWEKVAGSALPSLRKLDGLAHRSKTWQSFYASARTGFDWFRYKASERVLFTGYNSPLFPASLKETKRFAYPLYGLPADLVTENGVVRRRLPDGTLAPYYDRHAIEGEHVFKGRGLEIAWLESPSDALRLQIEGSGVLGLENGREIGVNYAGKNGRPFVSIFKILRTRGVEGSYLTFPGLKRYANEHPSEFASALLESPSYVFFALAKEPPCGAARVYVTPGHSVAVDPTQLPLGAPVLLSAERPVEGTDPETAKVPLKPFTRFAFAEDTGGAIKGAHVDVYWGTSDYATLASNSMQSRGDLFLLRAKADKSPKKAP